jgi:hypothetical protein
MKEYKVISEGDDRYLSCPCEQEDCFELKMLLANEIQTLLPVRIRHINGSTDLYYGIGERLSLSEWSEREPLSYELVARVCRSVSEAAKQAEEYMLAVKYIALKPELIFLDADRNVSFVYDWTADEESLGNLTNLCDFVLKHFDHSQDKEHIYRLYELYQKTSEGRFSRKNFVMGLPEEDRREEKAESVAVSEGTEMSEGTEVSEGAEVQGAGMQIAETQTKTEQGTEAQISEMWNPDESAQDVEGKEKPAIPFAIMVISGIAAGVLLICLLLPIRLPFRFQPPLMISGLVLSGLLFGTALRRWKEDKTLSGALIIGNVERRETAGLIEERKRDGLRLIAVSESNRDICVSKPFTLIGRDRKCDVMVKESSVSARHATVLSRKGHWYIRDEDSTNGTYVDNQPCCPDCLYEVKTGTYIRLADVEYVASCM